MKKIRNICSICLSCPIQCKATVTNSPFLVKKVPKDIVVAATFYGQFAISMRQENGLIFLDNRIVIGMSVGSGVRVQNKQKRVSNAYIKTVTNLKLLRIIFALKRKQDTRISVLFFNWVPGTGLEPARPYGHYTLNVARLPIPPSRR